MANTQPKLIVVSEQENDGPFFIDPRIESLIIGRGPDSEVCLPGPDVSPRHCRLFQQDGRWFVEDLGGASGTRINGTPITGVTEIDDVDRLELGAYTLQFLLEEPPEPPRPMRSPRPRSNVLQVDASPPPAQGVGAQPQPWPYAPAGAPTAPPPVGMGPGPQAPGMAPPSAPLPPVGVPPGPGMTPLPPPPGMGPPPAGPPPGGGRKSAAGPASKICKCGLLLMGDAGGFSCPVCKRKYDKGGQEMGAKASVGRGRGQRAGGSFLAGRTGLMVVGGVVVLAVLVVVAVIYFSNGSPSPSPNGTPPTTPKTEKLSDPTGKLLDIVVCSAIEFDVMSNPPKPPPKEWMCDVGKVLMVKIVDQLHPFRVVKGLKVTLAWNDDLAKVTSDLTGLSLQVLKKISVGSGSFEQDDVMDRKADGWYITRAKK